MSTKIQCTVLWVSVSVHVVVPKQRIEKTLSNYVAEVYVYHGLLVYLHCILCTHSTHDQ